MEFEEDVVLVTGATGGIGRAICQRLAEEGAQVAIHYRSSEEKAETLARQLPGGPHLLVHGDLAQQRVRQELIEAVVAELDQVDVLVNNAGVFYDHGPMDTTFEQWREAWEETITVNLQAPADLCYWAAKQMGKQGGGRIVNVSSRGAFRGEPGAPAYGASKAGLNALTQSLAKALGGRGITVSAVAPGFVETARVAGKLSGIGGKRIKEESPLDRVATPEEVAEAVAFLASERCPFTTGAILDVNGASYLRT